MITYSVKIVIESWKSLDTEFFKAIDNTFQKQTSSQIQVSLGLEQGLNTTSWERPISALFLRLKKRNVFEIVKGAPLGFLKLQLMGKYGKKRRGEPLETSEKFWKKNRN